MTATAAPETEEKTALPGGGAPVILKADEQGLASLFGFMSKIAPGNYNALAQAEARRLQPYFEAFSRHLQHDLQENPDLFRGRRERMQKLAEPGNLSRLFTTVAEQTGKVMLSEIVIAPSAVYDDAAISQRVFGGIAPYHSTTRYGTGKLIFGFQKQYEKDSAGERKSESDYAMLALDSRIMNAVTAYRPEAMLKAFQEISTFTNHDMIHHIHMDYGPPDHFYAAKPPGYHINDPRDIWLRNFNRDFSDQTPKIDDIESWHIMYHAKTLQYLDNNHVADAVQVYFEELARIGAEMKAQDTAAAQQTFDYFSSIAAATLARIIPLNHPLMADVLARIEAADPAPETTMEDAPKILEDAKKSLGYSRSYSDMIEDYAAEGFKIVEKDTTALSYAQMQILKLVHNEAMSVQLVGKARPNSYLGQTQAKTARIGLELIDNMARMVDFEPA